MKKPLTLFTAAFTLLLTSPLTFATFPDVPEDHYNYTAINYVQAGGIVSGHPDGTYKPDDKIDRAAFTKIIIESQYTSEEIEGCGSANFKDIPDGIWYDKYVCVAQKNKVIDGYPDGTFGGEKLINLAEASKIISNAFGYETQSDPETWYRPYIEELSQRGALPITLTGFSHQLTRGEMAEIIYRLLMGINSKNSLTYLELSTGELPNEEEKAELTTIEQALNYYLSILSLHKISDEEYNEFVFSFGENMANKFFDSTRKSLQNHINALEGLKQKIAEVEPYERDNTLVEGLLKNTDAKIEILTEDFSELIDLYEQLSQLNESSSESEVNELIDSINTLGNAIAQKVEASDGAMMQAYLDFGHKHGIPMHDINAMNYLNGISNFFSQALNAFSVYQTFAIDIGIEGDLDILEEQRTLSIKQLENVRDQVLNAGPYNQDSTLLDAILQIIDARIYILSELDSKIIDLYKEFQESPETFTQEDFDALEALDTEALEKMDSSAASYFQGVREFSDRYGFLEYIESSLPNKMHL